MKSLRFTNPRVGEIDLVNDGEVRLIKIEGVSCEANINVQTVAGYDGATVQSMAANERYITVDFRIRKQADAEAAQCRMYRIFAAKSSGTMHYEGRKGASNIDYVVKSCIIPPNNKTLTGTLTLVCPDPYFHGEGVTDVIVAGTVSKFCFPFTFPADGSGFYISERLADLFTEIDNDGEADTDITITITAIGTVVDPYLQDANTLEKAALDITLQNGDKVVITTGTDNKTATLTRSGIEANIFNALHFPFTFFKLPQGVTKFTYGAKAGRDKLNITVSFRKKYAAMLTNAPYQDSFRISDDEIEARLDEIARIVKRGGFNG